MENNAGASIMLTSVVLLEFKSLRKHFQLIVIFGLTTVSVTIMKTALTYYEGGLYNSSVAITAFIIFIHTLSRLRFIYTLHCNMDFYRNLFLSGSKH